jgi:HNH endonuclease
LAQTDKRLAQNHKTCTGVAATKGTRARFYRRAKQEVGPDPELQDMPIRSRTDLLAAIERLPNNVTFLRHSYKKGWLNWLSNYEDPSRATPDRSAKFIYNALNMPEWIIWLAAASGVEHELIERAAQAIDRRELHQTQAAAVRDILPWKLVAKHLETPTSHATIYDDVALDVDAIYRSGAKQTIKQTLIEARLGQGQFRASVAERWNGQCGVTGCSIGPLLRASHIKPWSKSSNRDRLNPANGILLAAHVDALFDCGLISFADDGMMLVSAQNADELKQFNLPDGLRREPTKAEKQFLAYHRRYVFAA